MINQNIKLNPHLFEDGLEQIPIRDGFGEGLVILGEENHNVVVLTADLSESTRSDGFAKKFPERFFEVGVAEQNMAAIAAGLGVSGKIPFISSYATFSPGKNWETIRTTIVYNKADVKIAGHHSGIMTGADGATHQATEDVAIMRTLPDIKIIVPCDANEAKKATIACARINGPFYLRFTRDKTPVITTEQTPFEIGKMQNLWTSQNPSTAIIGMGYMLYYCLLAARDLEKEGISTIVANASTVKPFDTQSLLDLAKKAGSIVSVEDHQIRGGLGSCIAEILAENHPIPMEFIGLKDTFAESGNPEDLRIKYHMDVKDIIDAVKKVISRK